MNYEQFIKETVRLCDKYRDDIANDNDFCLLSSCLVSQARKDKNVFDAFTVICGFLVSAYVIGRERGRKEAAMIAMLGNEEK